MNNRKDNTGKFTLPNVKISRQDIARAKQYWMAGGSEGYKEMIRLISHPSAVFRVRIIPGTKKLQIILNLLVVLGRIFPFAVITLFLFRHWVWAIGSIVAWLFIFNPIQTQINYEIGARLGALDDKMLKDGINI